MNEVVKFDRPFEHLSELTLEQLFERAEKFGRIHVYSAKHTAPPARYNVSIKFDSIPGTEVEASSDFRLTIYDAFVMAISRAESIVAAYK